MKKYNSSEPKNLKIEDRQGYVKAYRKVLDSQMYKHLTSKQRDVFWTCIMLANHQTNEWEWGTEIFKCEPGQFVTSLNTIDELTANDVSTQNIRSALLRLERWQFLTNKSTKTGRLITIINWERYQDGYFKTNKDTNKELTKSQQRANKELTTIKNVKNDNNVKNKEYAQFVKMTPEENQKLIDKFGELGCLDWIERLNLWKGSKGKKTRSDYMTILSWERRDRDKNKPEIPVWERVGKL